eukprot:12366363-Ditylum_brightwellii.AAC.1
MAADGALLIAKAIGTWDCVPDAPGRSKCGGDGGDGRLAFSFEGNGYYESSSAYIDGDLCLMNHFLVKCPGNTGNMAVAPF